MNDRITCWGIDLGGTKIEGVVMQPHSHEPIRIRKRIATEGSAGYRHVLNQIKSLVDQFTEELGESPKSLGIGTPGCLDPVSGLLRGSNSRHLNDKPLIRDLEDILGVPVVIENDANCFALAETRWGAVRQDAPGARSVFGIILGTGVGGGIVIDDQLVNGPHSITGEWGHNPLDDSGGQCYCGQIGCVETILSGPALEKFYTSISGVKRPLEEIHQRSKSGDTAAAETIDRLVRFFGKAISGVINIIDPDVIVVGGGVGNIDELYQRAPLEITRHIFAPSLQTIILKPSLGDSAGVIGAAYLTLR